MSQSVRTAVILILLAGLATAQYHSIGEIFDQQTKTQTAVNELKQDVKDLRTQINDSINQIGIKNVVGFITAYIMLNCFAYLFKRIKDYINRNKIKHDRDKFVDNLKKQFVLQGENMTLMKAERKDLAENLTLYRQLFGREFKQPQYNKILFIGGILACILGAILAYQGNVGPADLLLILGFLSLLVCGLLYLFSIRRFFTTSSTVESHIVEAVLGTTLPSKQETDKNQQTQDTNKAEDSKEVVAKKKVKEPIKDHALQERITNTLASKKEGYLTAELQQLLALEGHPGYLKLLDALRTLQNEQKITFDMVGTNKRRWKIIKQE